MTPSAQSHNATPVVSSWIFLALACVGLWAYLVMARPVMGDDGFVYQSFSEILVDEGRFDFKNHYGFMGLSLLNAPVYFLTRSHNSIIYTSLGLMFLLLPIGYWTALRLGLSDKASRMALCLLLLYPEPQVVLFKGFQEAAHLVFAVFTLGLLAGPVVLWTPLVFGFTCIIKPFAAAYLPILLPNFLTRKRWWLLLLGAVWVIIHLGLTWLQTGHLINSSVNNIYNAHDIPNLKQNFNFSPGSWISLLHALFISVQMQVSPVIILAGLWGICKMKCSIKPSLLLLAVMINWVMVGLMVGMFSKYLLPATVLLIFTAAPVLSARPAWMIMTFVTSLPMLWYLHYAYIGTFWNHTPILMIPACTALILWCWLERTWLLQQWRDMMERRL